MQRAAGARLDDRDGPPRPRHPRGAVLATGAAGRGVLIFIPGADHVHFTYKASTGDPD